MTKSRSLVFSILLLPFAAANADVNAMVPGVSIFSIGSPGAETNAMVPGVSIFSVESPDAETNAMVPGVSIFSIGSPDAETNTMVPGVTIFSAKRTNADVGLGTFGAELVLSPVPEPATAMLWSFGLMSVAWASRRKSRRSETRAADRARRPRS